MRSMVWIVAAVLVGSIGVVARAQQGSANELMNEFKGQAAAKDRSAAQWEADYAIVMKAILPRIGATDAGARRDPQESLERMCFHASRPGAPVQRSALAKAMAACLGADVAVDARVWILRQLENIGRAEVVEAVGGLLGDSDSNLRTRAICALANNPSSEAAAKLRAALEQEKTPQWQVALINALGFRADAVGLPMLRKLLDNRSENVAAAAAAALGRIGNWAAAEALAGARSKAEPAVHETVMDAYMMCATKLLGKGQRDEAGIIFANIAASKEPKHYLLGAMRGLVMALPEDKAAALIVKGLESGDAQMAATAGRLVVEMPGAAAAQAVGAKLAGMAPETKVIVLRALADRADTGAAAAVMEAVRNNDAAVRLAAIVAMGKVGGSAAVMVLAQAGAAGNAEELAAARESLASLRGADVDSAILAGIPQAQAKARCELVRSLAARRATGAVPTLLDLAVKDADAQVRVEAINAIGVLGDEKQLANLVAILFRPQAESDGRAAEAAATSIMARVADPEKRAEPVLAGLENASGASRVALVRALGRTGSSKALSVLRKALGDENPEIQLAAVRALADWPTVAVAGDLLAVARTNAKENLKVLALRGYVRVVGLPSGRTPAQTANMLEEAMKLARPEDKKMVLSGLANVPAIEALKLVEPCVDQAELAAEAQTAAVTIAAAIAGSNSDEVVAVMRKVAVGAKDQNIAQQAREVMRKINGSEGFITDWMASGPYEQAGKSERELFDIAFPPEKGEGKWKLMKKSGGPEMDFSSSDMAGDNRCAYLRTSVWSPKAQDVQLEVGSDDGIKVWMNGKVVHANNTNRGSALGQDAVKVTLNEGWNVLLLKVTNGGGGWGANARLCMADGTKMPGMKIKAE
ncbi:MAG: HEAT repeat domain-containing protein [Planctomycetota bacterium]|nr:HEAT repeat domain-containing protein [Planctomycetota bacterium]